MRHATENFTRSNAKMADLRPLLTFIFVISGKLCQIALETISIKQNVRLHEGYTRNNFSSIKINVNGQLSAIIYLIMRNIWKTITIRQNVLIRIKLEIPDCRPLFSLICVKSEKPCQTARPLTLL